MSARRYYNLQCDHPGCEAMFTAHVDRADATRAEARARGCWMHGVVPPDPNRGGPAKSLDYCSEHALDLGDLKPKALPQHAREA